MGVLVPAEWDEAFDLVATKFGEIKDNYGANALAALSSAHCTNEENYLMQKFMRAVIGTNNIDHCARVCHAPTVAGLAVSFGSGASTNSFGEISNAKVMFVIGANPTEAHPVVGTKIKQALAKGAKLIVTDPRQIELAENSDLWLRLRPGTDVALINGIMNIILANGWEDRSFIEERTEGFEEARKKFEDAWGVSLDPNIGIMLPDMFKAAINKDLRTMYIMGEDPVITDADANHVRKGLESLDFLVVQDIFMSETAKLADVVLPGASYAEKSGTFTNAERRVQMVNQVIKPIGNAKTDGEIIIELADRMGYPFSYYSSEQVMQEVAGLTPLYAGITHERLGNARIAAAGAES